MDVLATAGRGLLAAGDRLAASAQRVSRLGFDETVDLTHEVVEQVKAKQEWKANLQVIRFADDMWRALLAIQSR